MLNRLDLQHFKCFELLRLPLGPLTLLSGSMAPGSHRSSRRWCFFIRLCANTKWSTRLMLNCAAIRLGTVADVVDQAHGRRSFEIGLMDGEIDYHWTFTGDRSEMSMAVDRVAIGAASVEAPEVLRYLLATHRGETATLLANASEVSHISPLKGWARARFTP